MPQLIMHDRGRTRKIEANRGARLLDVIRNAGFELQAPCGGNGTCGKCRVKLSGGDYVNACVFIIRDDLEVYLPEPLESSVLTAQYEYLRELPLMPGEAVEMSTNPMGVAIDIGTTSIALYMVQLVNGTMVETRSMMNPQGSYGADVISRINYTISHEAGTTTLQKVLIDGINSVLQSFLEDQEVSESDLVKIVVTGNTTMLHLFLGVEPRTLAFVPFTPVFSDIREHRISETGLRGNPDGFVKVLPSVSAYIGSDILAGVASLAPPEHHLNYLFIDIGTNGELVLVTPDGTYCCATAAGPAFEGAAIEHGMGAFDGAIHRFSPLNGYHTIGDKPAAGICGSGLVDLVAFMVEKSIIDKDGLLESDYEVAGSGKTRTGTPIVISQADIRELQLAKSAVHAGINTLLFRAGLSVNALDAVYLAGGLGNYIKVESAVTIGLIPAELQDKVIPVGNTSGSGAIIALKSDIFISELERLRSTMKYIELSNDDVFILEFAMNMAF